MNRLLSALKSNKFEQPYTHRNSVEWIQSGRNYFDKLIQLIDTAELEVHLQTYIFLSDETGQRVARALMNAAGRGVQVFLLVDAYGSQSLSSQIIKQLKSSGVIFRKYGILYSRGSFHIGRRMHHKITTIDGFISVVGGINIANHYNDIPGLPAWLDFAVVMKGDISRRIQYMCRKMWSKPHFEKTAKKKLLGNLHGSVKLFGNVPIRIRKNDFLQNKFEITISYREALRRSEKSILLVGGYFLPGGRTRRLMKQAAERGVTIDVVVSEKSDVKLVNYARRFLYDWMIKNGINVHEYKTSNVHGKVLIADDKWTSIGSYDLNNLSAYSNIELNVDIRNDSFTAGLAENIRNIIQNECTQISKDARYRNKTILMRFVMWFAYRTVKTLFVLSVLLAGNKEKEF